MNKNILKKALYLTLIFLPTCKAVNARDDYNFYSEVKTLGTIISAGILAKCVSLFDEEEVQNWSDEEEVQNWSDEEEVQNWSDEEEEEALVQVPAQEAKQAYDEVEQNFKKWEEEVNLLAEIPIPQNIEIIIDQEALLEQEAEQERLEEEEEEQRIAEAEAERVAKIERRLQARLTEEARQAQILEEQERQAQILEEQRIAEAEEKEIWAQDRKAYVEDEEFYRELQKAKGGRKKTYSKMVESHLRRRRYIPNNLGRGDEIVGSRPKI